MLKIYGIKNCNTMKKTFDWLALNQIEYEFHDYKKKSIDAETILQWLQIIDSDVLLNKKGTTWRKLDPEQQQQILQSTPALVEGLIAHSSMIKRPVTVVDDQNILVGFDQEQYQQKLIHNK